jgi:hypothetical protein
MTPNTDVKLQINVIFHKNIYPHCYAFPDEFLNKYFRFIAVNDTIDKIIPERFKELVFYENQFKNFYPKCQSDGLKENSVLLHFYFNQDFIQDIDLIGFLQYDMKITELFTEHINIILNHHTRSPETIYILQYVCGKDYLEARLTAAQWKYICDIYNHLFNKNHTMEEVYYSQIPIWNSFILPKKIFNDMMLFSSKVLDLIAQFHIEKGEAITFCQTMEVVHGFFLTLYCMDSKIKWYMLNGITHDFALKV